MNNQLARSQTQASTSPAATKWYGAESPCANEPATQDEAYARVQKTYLRWKNRRISDRCALYHTELDIKTLGGGVAERVALMYLRFRLCIAGPK